MAGGGRVDGSVRWTRRGQPPALGSRGERVPVGRVAASVPGPTQEEACIPHCNLRIPRQLEKNYVVPHSSKYEAFARYSPARGAGTLIPSAQRLVWAAKQPLGNAALGALFAPYCDEWGTTLFFSSCRGILELQWGIQASSCVGPGKSNHQIGRASCRERV